MSADLDRTFAMLRETAAADPHGVVPTTALLTIALLVDLHSVEVMRVEVLTPERRQMLTAIRRHAAKAMDQFRRLASLAQGLDVDAAELLARGVDP